VAAIGLGLAAIGGAMLPASAAMGDTAVHHDGGRAQGGSGWHDGHWNCQGAGCYTYGYGPFYRGYGQNSNNWCYEGESMYDGC
jgi:hypothetical protein